MLYLSGSEWLFWGGIGTMVLSVALGIMSVVVFTFTGRGIQKRLEQEYGKPDQ